MEISTLNEAYFIARNLNNKKNNTQKFDKLSEDGSKLQIKNQENNNPSKFENIIKNSLKKT